MEEIDTMCFVSIGNLSELQLDGYIKVNIPFESCQDFIFRLDYINYDSDSNYTWCGEVYTDDTVNCYTGTIILIAREGQKFGHITIDSNIYEMYDLDGKNILAKIVLDTNRVECGLPTDTTQQDIIGKDTRTSSPCSVINLLVVYNQSAITWLGTEKAIKNKIALAFAQTQYTLLRSYLPSTVRINLVGTQKITWQQVSTLKLTDEIGNLYDNATVKGLRNDYKADIVVFLTGDTYIDYAGISGNLYLYSEEAYCIVSFPESTAQYTFTHEIGHIFTCRHNRAKDNYPSYNHGYGGYKTFGFESIQYDHFCTVMTIPEGKFINKRIMNFSNPFVKYKNLPTGTLSEFNALALSYNAYTVQQFRNDPSFTANIIGPKFNCSGYVSSFEIYTQSGSAPYTYEWQLSNDGTNWTSYATSQPVNILFPSVVNGKKYIRCIVQDYYGNRVTTDAFTITSVLAYQETDGTWVLCPRILPENVQNTTKEAINIYPNPSNDMVTISVDLKNETNLDVKIIDVFGSVYNNFNTTNIQGKRNFTVPLNNYSSGTYFVKISTNNNTFTKKIVVTK